jgi:prevent-host-death family protein
MTMIVINIHEAKAKLSEYLDAVAKGERVLICKRNQPVAELRAVEQKRTEPRTIGGGPYHFDVPASFFEPMPDEFLDAFESGPVYPESQSPPSRVAEVPARYDVGRGHGVKTTPTTKDTNIRKIRKKRKVI